MSKHFDSFCPKLWLSWTTTVMFALWSLSVVTLMMSAPFVMTMANQSNPSYAEMDVLLVVDWSVAEKNETVKIALRNTLLSVPEMFVFGINWAWVTVIYYTSWTVEHIYLTGDAVNYIYMVNTTDKYFSQLKLPTGQPALNDVAIKEARRMLAISGRVLIKKAAILITWSVSNESSTEEAGQWMQNDYYVLFIIAVGPTPTEKKEHFIRTTGNATRVIAVQDVSAIGDALRVMFKELTEFDIVCDDFSISCAYKDSIQSDCVPTYYWQSSVEFCPYPKKPMDDYYSCTMDSCQNRCESWWPWPKWPKCDCDTPIYRGDTPPRHRRLLANCPRYKRCHDKCPPLSTPTRRTTTTAQTVQTTIDSVSENVVVVTAVRFVNITVSCEPCDQKSSGGVFGTVITVVIMGMMMIGMILFHFRRRKRHSQPPKSDRQSIPAKSLTKSAVQNVSRVKSGSWNSDRSLELKTAKSPSPTGSNSTRLNPKTSAPSLKKQCKISNPRKSSQKVSADGMSSKRNDNLSLKILPITKSQRKLPGSLK